MARWTIALRAVECTAASLMFITDMDDLGTYREARNRLSVTPPAVTLVEVSRLYGPDFLIEIEATAAAA